MNDSGQGTVPVITLRPAQPDDDDFLFDLYASTRRAEMETWGLDEAMLAGVIHKEDLEGRTERIRKDNKDTPAFLRKMMD